MINDGNWVFWEQTGLPNSPKTKVINGIMLLVLPQPFLQVSWRCNLKRIDWLVVPGAWVPNPPNKLGRLIAGGSWTVPVFEPCDSSTCLSLQVFATDLSECTPLNPYWFFFLSKITSAPSQTSQFRATRDRHDLAYALCPYVARNQGPKGHIGHLPEMTVEAKGIEVSNPRSENMQVFDGLFE